MEFSNSSSLIAALLADLAWVVRAIQAVLGGVCISGAGCRRVRCMRRIIGLRRGCGGLRGYWLGFWRVLESGFRPWHLGAF